MKCRSKQNVISDHPLYAYSMHLQENLETPSFWTLGTLRNLDQLQINSYDWIAKFDTLSRVQILCNGPKSIFNNNYYMKYKLEATCPRISSSNYLTT